MGHFSIKDVADFTGLEQHTIRVWEQRYSFLHPRRTKDAINARRTYTAEEINVLLDVTLLNQEGYKISQIDKLTFEEKLLIVSKVLDQQQQSINSLIIEMAKMNAKRFKDNLNHCQDIWGHHKTIQEILLPFCDIVGLLQNNESKKYEENILVIKQGIKQMLYAAIDNTDINSTRNKMVVLFISSNEIQEVPLLFLQYFLKVNGFSTIYLGYILSIRQLENICQHLNPAYIITTSAKKNTNKDLCAFVKKLSNTNSKSEFISIENKIKACDEEHYKYTNDIAETLDLLLGGKKVD